MQTRHKISIIILTFISVLIDKIDKKQQQKQHTQS